MRKQMQMVDPYLGGYKMSKDAADLFRLSQDDLWKFLSYDQGATAKPTSAPKVLNNTKHMVLVVSVSLFAIAFFICCVTLFTWAILRSRRRRNDTGITTESANLACDEKSLPDTVQSPPSLPQIFDQPRPPAEIRTRNSIDGEELQKLHVESVDLTASFYTNQNRLQVNVRRVNLTNFNESLRENAFMYLVVSLEPGTPFDPSYYESELRPIASENYFEEASDFEVTLDDISSISLKVSVYANDRFSQHRLVNAYTYQMSCTIDPDATTQSPVVSVALTEASRSEDMMVPHGVQTKAGELLFSLCYMPTSGRLTFIGLKARNICDNEFPLVSYLRVALMVSGKTVKTVQTTNRERMSSNPVYNDSHTFHAPLERIKDTNIAVTVLSPFDKSGSQTKTLGKVIVGPASSTIVGRKHWEAMLSAPRRPLAQWHSISECL